MRAVSDEKVLLEYFGSTGFIILKEGSKIYLADTRFHKFVFLFPHLTYLTTLKLYDVSGLNVHAPLLVETEGKNEIYKQAGMFGSSIGLIIYGQNILPISNNLARWLVVIFTVCLILYKYISHISFLTNLGNKYNFMYSNLKTIKAKVKFDNTENQKSYDLQVLGYCCADILIILLAFFCINQNDSFIIIISMSMIWFHILVLPISRLMEGKKHLEFENKGEN